MTSTASNLIALAESIDLRRTRAHFALLQPAEAGERGFRSTDVGGLWVYWEGAGADRVARVGGLGLTGPATRKQVEEVVRLAASDAATVRLRLAPTPGAGDARAWLLEMGFRVGARLIQWARTTEDAPEAPCPYPIRPVEPTEAHEFARLIATNYRLPKGTGLGWYARQVGAPGMQCLLACEGATPIATGVLSGEGEACVLGYGTTLRSHRGRGIQQAMIAARLHLAREQGYAWATSSTLGRDRSGRNLARLGFAEAGEVQVWTR